MVWAATTSLDEYNLIPISKVFMTKDSSKRAPFKCVNGNTSESLCEV